MAKKKELKNTQEVQNQEVIQTENMEQVKEQETVQTENMEQVKEQETVQTENMEQVKEQETVQTENMEQEMEQKIPEFARVLLEDHPGYESLYIDKMGGMFTADTQPSLVKDAILYKNPYYTK